MIVAVWAVWFFFSLFAARVAWMRGRTIFGWFLIGCLMGPFGFVASLLLPENSEALDKRILGRG